MNRFTRTATALVLVTVLLVSLGQTANAGRIGGAVSGITTLGAYQTTFFDIPFFANETAIIAVAGNGRTRLDLYVYDGVNNGWPVIGVGDQKSVAIDVTRAGYFRVVVRNLGPAPNTFILSTN
jgi:hypothetical protein